MNTLMNIRAPISVNLEVTERCNLSCSFCFNATSDYRTLMSAAEQIKEKERTARLFQILEKLAEFEVFEIRFFGGEFTVFKRWRNLMKHAADLGFFLSFVSNGYSISEQDADFFKECGITQCNISMHGDRAAHDRIVGIEGSFDRAVVAINAMHVRDIAVTVSYTPVAGQIGNVYPFVKYLIEQHFVRDFGINRLFRDDRYVNLEHADYMRLLEVIARCHLELGARIALSDSFPRCMVPADFWPYLSYCSQGIGFGQVDFMGKLKHCSAISHTLGNILQAPLEQLWEESLKPMRQLEHLPRSCKMCPIFCGGGCTASRGTNNTFVPDEFIPWPQEEGLFRALLKTAASYIRKIYFETFVHPEFTVNQPLPPLSDPPIIEGRYKARKESSDTYLIMFERAGLRIVSGLAHTVLSLVNGQRTLAEIASACEARGHSVDTSTVKVIIQQMTASVAS